MPFPPGGGSRAKAIGSAIAIVIVISRLLKRYLEAKSTRAPAYSRALWRIKGRSSKGWSREAQASESFWRDFIDGAPALTSWLTRPIESCSDLSPIVNLMSCMVHHLLKEKPTPLRSLSARSHNFILPLKEKRNFISRAIIIPCSRCQLNVKTAGMARGEQYFIINQVHNRYSLSSFHR